MLAGVGVFLLSRLGLHTSHLTSSLYMIVLGLGIGLIMQVMVLVAQNSASYADLGAATGAVNLARQVGSSVGVALIGAPIYLYLVPLVAAAFVLALILPERTLRTRAFTAIES